MKFPALTLALLAFCLPAIASAAGSWWSGDWKYRKEFGLDSSPTGADIAGTATDVPVLIRLSLGNFSYFNDTKADGSDFRLIAGDDKTPLKFHIEKYDAANQIALIWVRVPQATGGAKSDKFYAYYGNADAPAASDVPGTYDTPQVLVLSFSETSGKPLDGTAYKNNPDLSTAQPNSASLIGGGVKFSGKELIRVPDSASLRLVPEQGFTASAWLRIDQAQQAVVFALSDQTHSLQLAVDGSKLVARASLGGAPVTVTQPSDLALGTWHHVAISAGAGKLVLYVDGVAAGSAPVTLAELHGPFTVGSDGTAAFLTGEVDEVEVAKTVRSADWIKASARSQAAEGNLVLYGADGQKEGGGQTSYIGTILKSLTLDGWVVIGICMAMLVVALLIMLLKMIFLTRVERANHRFMRDFRQMSGDPTVLDSKGTSEDDDLITNPPSMGQLAGDQNKYGASTLYRLYHHGVFELNKRIGHQTLSASQVTALSDQSINAIRASMDASLTRLQQTLSSQMVLLTIAISGGPFLGLLGTVIGVMITFAAIAAAGDVNVNAIAPGTAAALAATVAGLLVAIPSLFGYNWLNTRIKSILADNRVFVDEFVTRIAEEYS
jgi:biopolymer transport protein ExbB